MGRAGFEPAANGLKVRCSTAELTAHICVFLLNEASLAATNILCQGETKINQLRKGSSILMVSSRPASDGYENNTGRRIILPYDCIYFCALAGKFVHFPCLKLYFPPSRRILHRSVDRPCKRFNAGGNGMSVNIAFRCFITDTNLKFIQTG